MVAPSRKDIINGSLLAIMGWAKRGQNVIDDPERLMKVVNALKKSTNELFLYANTPDEQGKAWQWWE